MTKRTVPPLTLSQERTPPHTLEVEQAVLGGLLLATAQQETGLFTETVRGLNEEMFYVGAHKTIFRAIRDLHEGSLAPDLVTMTDRLRQRGELERVGGAVYVTSLLEATVGPFMLPQHIALLWRDWRKRLLADLGGELWHAALNGQEPEELLTLAEHLIAGVREIDSFSSAYRDSDKKNNLRVNAAALLDDAEESGDDWWPFLQPKGILRPGVLAVLSGYAKSGKTTTCALALDAVLRTRPDLRVVWCSEEHQDLWRDRLRRWHLQWPTVDLVFPGSDWQALVAQLAADPPGLVIVDTARTILPIEDENSASDWIRALAPLLVLARKHDVAVLLLHHLRKSGGDPTLSHAGSHAPIGVVDVAIELRRDPHAPHRRVIRTISRFPDTPPAWVMELRDDGLATLGDPEVVIQADISSRLVDTLDETPRMTSGLITELGDPTPSSARLYAALKDLHRQGIAGRQGRGTRGNPYRWTARAKEYSSSLTPLRVEEKNNPPQVAR